MKKSSAAAFEDGVRKVGRSEADPRGHIESLKTTNNNISRENKAMKEQAKANPQ